MKKQTKKRKRAPRKNEGRPVIKFDAKKWQEFEQLCALQCTQVEILEWFGIDNQTLTRLLKLKYKMSYSQIYRIKRTKGLVSLRRSQIKLSQASAAMAIFLGKNYLGQRDKTEVVNLTSLEDKYRKMTPKEREAELKRLNDNG